MIKIKNSNNELLLIHSFLLCQHGQKVCFAFWSRDKTLKSAKLKKREMEDNKPKMNKIIQ